MSRQLQQQAAVQERYEAALDALIARIKQDPYILAAMLFGSLARGEAWERSDIDLVLIQRDGLKPESRGLWLTEDDLNFWVEVISRNLCRRQIEQALQGSQLDSVYAHGKLLFSKDDSITGWLARARRIGARDRHLQLLRVVANVPPLLDKAEKWFYVQEDCHYSFVASGWPIRASSLGRRRRPG
jgi:predicted nucleotidyltransferase